MQVGGGWVWVLGGWWDAASGTGPSRWGWVVGGWVLRGCWADLICGLAAARTCRVPVEQNLRARQRRSRCCESSPAGARRNPASALARACRDRRGHCLAPLDEKESASAAAGIRMLRAALARGGCHAAVANLPVSAVIDAGAALPRGALEVLAFAGLFGGAACGPSRVGAGRCPRHRGGARRYLLVGPIRELAYTFTLAVR